MEMEGLDEVYKLQRFLPTPEEAVGYFLPCLLRGETMHGAEKLIRHDAQVYASEEPKDLAKRFAPVPTAVTSGDRFFFTTCKRNPKNGRCARGAGAGTWEIQKTEDINDDEGIKIGESRTLSFKKGKGKDKVSTGWVMEEYRCLLPQAVVAQGEMVLCRIHLAQNAPAAARQESDAYKLRRQEPAEQAPAPRPAEPVTVTVTASAHAQKRPAPVAAADLSSCKKMRIATPIPVPEPEEEYEDCPVWPAAPVSTTLPAASTEVPQAADDDTGSCTWEELFREEQQTFPVEADHDLDQLLQSLLAENKEEAELQMKSCNHNFDLQGHHNQFSFAPVY